MALSSYVTVIVDVVEFSLKSRTPSVFFRIELILALPAHPQHPETFRRYIFSAATDACEKVISVAQRSIAAIIFLIVIC